jgi:hypothetical protein
VCVKKVNPASHAKACSILISIFPLRPLIRPISLAHLAWARMQELARPSGPWAPYRFTKRCFVCKARAAFGTERSTDAALPKEQEIEKGRNLGNFGLGRAMHCAKHKRAGEVDVVTRRCTRSGCFRTAIFGLPGRRAIHCSEHKEKDNIDLKASLPLPSCLPRDNLM